jgi:ABC-type polysaccharide/polyol phosphate transport system ATPase subunit
MGSFKFVIMNITRPQQAEQFTALDDISFTIPHGQTVAIVGRNGSGKSTMMSLLARVMLPTSGTIRLVGRDGGRPRIAPLLEVGAGFHPDLIGEDNVKFYGAMLGMSEQEMEAQWNSIIEFSEVRDKIDTPMREWNEGSKLRLGFSVAVHTNPDILLIDEVLAVGDEKFREKCYRRIQELRERGVTLVFVTHDLKAAERIAERVIWIDRSHLRMDGDVADVVAAYRAAS